jgi:hypothetical protein
VTGRIRLSKKEFHSVSKKKISEWLRRGFSVTVRRTAEQARVSK